MGLLLACVAGLLSSTSVLADQAAQPYKGATALNVVSIGPNEDRCGPLPNLEAVFEGAGVDTGGGIVSVSASGCQNIETGEIFDLMAVDTYANGTINIVADPFFLVPNPQTCVSSNDQPVKFDIDGGTGVFDGARGGGKFDFAFNDPNCNGQVAPTYIWFKGKIKD
ncbi:hypothetical protein [Paraliomyxa miuraensis]|uniref:hypothetical protein n=1 Tax=Paraliomyxa miuraensis TaxID=376150 RepID=UPI00225A6BD8|nr:hypothetical protein [Paraliomyxa miuraensis]MCX4243309.1 hypothetical protein [Paraliomyxa miuraensis]